MDGACHCGAVQFTVKLAENPHPRRCTCSICRMRGAVVVSASIDDLKVTAGSDVLTRYQFNTRTAEYYFCSICGIHTHNKTRLHPDIYAVNTACLKGMSPFDFECVPVYDGVRHPKDFPVAPGGGIAGELRYEKKGP